MARLLHILAPAALAMLQSISAAAEPNLVPVIPSTAPDYFCTWNAQGFACSYSNASDQADMMVEANLFGTGPNQNWLGFYPQVRGDLTFLLDDAWLMTASPDDVSDPGLALAIEGRTAISAKPAMHPGKTTVPR